MIDCLIKVFTVGVTAFLPVSEMFVAIPTGLALQLDGVSVWMSTVVGSMLPLLLIHFLFEQMMRHQRIQRWFMRLATPQVQMRANQYGLWFVLLATPLTGSWAMAVTTKALGMNVRKVWAAAFASICLYAFVVTLALFCGATSLKELVGLG